jgi:hypothetical protein
MEKQGGPAGFEAWLKAHGRTTPAPIKKMTLSTTKLASNDISVNAVGVQIWSIIAYTYISVDIPGGPSGSGGAWGPGLGEMTGAGALTITNGDTDVVAWSQQVTNFVIESTDEGVGGASIQFLAGDSVIGVLLVVGDGLDDSVGFGGSFSFSN